MPAKLAFPGSMNVKRSALVLALLCSLAMSGSLLAMQEGLYKPGYLRPNPVIEDILTRDAHSDNLQSLSPDGTRMLVPKPAPFSNLERLSRRVLRLGMLEINPDTNRAWSHTGSGSMGFRIFSLQSRQSVDVNVPEGTLVSDMVWSPDGSQVAFLANMDGGSQVWVADAATGRAKALNSAYVMATLTGRRRGQGSGSRLIQWTPEGAVLTLLVPSNRGPEPAEPAVANSPLIRHTRKKKTPTPTYPFLLRTENDKDLFEYYTTSQPAILSATGQMQKVGEPGSYESLSLSPDGKHILASKIVRPYSHLVSQQSFGRELLVLDRMGSATQIRKIPLNEAAVRSRGRNPAMNLPRDVAWRPDGKGLAFLWRERPERSDEEDEEEEDSGPPSGPRTDRLMTLAAPFNVDQAQTLVSSKRTFNDVVLSADGRYAFARMTGRGEGTDDKQTIAAYDLSANGDMKVLADGIDDDDLLTQPRSVLAKASPNGLQAALLSADSSSAYLEGEGYREDYKPRPFIDRVVIDTGATERVFESAADAWESPVAALDADLQQIVISRESPTEFPNNFVRGSDGANTQLTSNTNPFPEVGSVRRLNFTFTRRDGLEMQGRISLPNDYQPGSRVPGVFWTYPREFESAKAYKNSTLRSRNHNRFARMNYRNASDIWLTQGYAVIDPDVPIVGPGNTYNNNYRAHLVDSMYAAIRKLDQMGYVDVDRLGHGGHSYGAFATANILAHSPFFKAGIAGDGAYNRSLTPMTFQRERRYLWEATDTIIEMSPFFFADHLDAPLLMYHGADDNNTGTFLMQSERMMQALTGLGKTAALYIYPYESHGPRAIETYFDMWNRWLGWFDKYVKGAELDSEEAVTGSRP